VEHKKGRGHEGPQPGGAFGGASAEALLVNELLAVGGEDIREAGPGIPPLRTQARFSTRTSAPRAVLTRSPCQGLLKSSRVASA
jgi:hypothetical protein